MHKVNIENNPESIDLTSSQAERTPEPIVIKHLFLLSRVRYDEQMYRKSLFFNVLLLSLVSVSWFFWSFTLTDPNLYFSSNSVWVTFQQFLWQTPKTVVVWWFGVNTVLAFLGYLIGVRGKLSFHPLLLIPCLLLLLSNNALSHDLYNYMFNAKAVLLYHADPHIQSALQIAPQDEWLRFMHNVHTEAPYGRIWTYLSLIPSVLGMGKFLPTFLSFKLFMAVGLGMLVWLQYRLLEDKRKIWLFLLNPLVLTETLINGHNDIWMMGLFFSSLFLLQNSKRVFSLRTLLSLVLFLLSTQIKLSTVLLVPVWIFFVMNRQADRIRLSQWIEKIRQLGTSYWAEFCAVLLFLPLLTDRAQQFHPWYLIWSLSFLPFFKSRFLTIWFLVFSISSTFRYIPFLFLGEYTDAIQLQMRLITWSAVPISIVVWMWGRANLYKEGKHA